MVLPPRNLQGTIADNFPDGHYLNLPVMNEPGEIVGMVDVLKLTYATLEQINTMGSGDSEGPAWGKFWLSLDNDSESMVSEGGSHRPHTPGHRSGLMTPDLHRPITERVDSVQPNESASHHGDDDRSDSPEPPSAVAAELPFPFKFKAPSGRVHKLQVTASQGIEELVASVTGKLGGEIEAVGGEATVQDGKLLPAGYALSYLDNEGDSVSITVDRDVLDAISNARRNQLEKVDLFVHHPEKPPISATLDPHPALAKPLTPPASTTMKNRRKHHDEDEEEDQQQTPVRKERKAASKMKQPEQVVAGVPNELLLPGAIGVLAVVIVGVFAFSRSSRN